MNPIEKTKASAARTGTPQRTERLALDLTADEADALRWVKTNIPGAHAQIAHTANRAALPAIRDTLRRYLTEQLAREARGEKLRHKLPNNLAAFLATDETRTKKP